jgi:hypothetical protein
MHVLEQNVEGHCCQYKEYRIHQVGHDAHADELHIREYIPNRGRCIAGDVYLGVHKSFGEAAGDADEQVEDAGDSREALG